MGTTADRIRELIVLLEQTAERELRLWSVLLPGRDRWRLFAEYRYYCDREQEILSFIQAARHQVARIADPARYHLTARIAGVEAKVGRAGAPVHRRFLEALSEPDVPLPLGSAGFLRHRLVGLARLELGTDNIWQRPLPEVARALAARAHDFQEFTSRP